MVSQTGFAAYNNRTGVLNLKTLFTTVQGCVVNSLVVVCNILPITKDSEEDIVDAWRNLTRPGEPFQDWSIVKCTVQCEDLTPIEL